MSTLDRVIWMVIAGGAAGSFVGLLRGFPEQAPGLILGGFLGGAIAAAATILAACTRRRH